MANPYEPPTEVNEKPRRRPDWVFWLGVSCATVYFGLVGLFAIWLPLVLFFAPLLVAAWLQLCGKRRLAFWTALFSLAYWLAYFYIILYRPILLCPPDIL